MGSPNLLVGSWSMIPRLDRQHEELARFPPANQPRDRPIDAVRRTVWLYIVMSRTRIRPPRLSQLIIATASPDLAPRLATVVYWGGGTAPRPGGHFG